MSIKQTLKTLRNHVREEGRIHKELLEEARGDAKHLIQKHWADTLEIHKTFWKDLKEALKNR